MIRSSRRRVLGMAAASFAGIAAPRLVFAQQKTAVKFALPWVSDGTNLFTYVAKGMGFWDRHGLDVSLLRGSGSVAAAQAVAAGRFEFGMAAALAAILQNVKGLSLTALGCCAYDAAMGIGVMNDGPVRKPKDLEGKTMGSTVTSGEFPFLPAFAARAGFDLKQVKIVQVDNKVRDQLLPQGKVDAISGFASGTMAEYVAQGVKAHFMLFSEYGIANYGNTILTQSQRLAAAPQLCAALVDGMLEGLKATLLDPAEATRVFFKQVPEMALAAQSRERIRVGTGITNCLSARESLTTEGLGWIDPKEYAAQTDLVMTYLAAPGDKRPALAETMTNRLVGHSRLTAAEWAQVQKSAQDFRAYVS